MRAKAIAIPALVALVAGHAGAQSVLFDFDNASPGSPFPISLTVGGITAQFTATGSGYSIQSANTMGFTPAGFAGYCIYPSSVFAADLLVAFSVTLTNFSILYSPQELGCDDSARMRVTAYMGTSFVATATTTASAPGTWPSETLGLGATQGFDHVVVHYDAKPPTCQDWGPIFLADIMSVAPAPVPYIPPTIQITMSATDAQIAWPASYTGCAVQVNTDLMNTNTWFSLTNVPATAGGQCTVILPMDQPYECYRLLQP